MKKLLTFLAAVPLFTAAQDCKNFLFMTNNSTVQMTVYDKKGNESGVQTWKITDVKKSGSSYESNVTSTFTNDKGKEMASGKGIYKCDGGVLKADVRLSMPQEQMKAYGDAEAKFEPTYIEYPSKPAEGQSLKDVDFKMELTSKNGISTTITFKETDRKVDKKESVTTAAGTWDAYIITYNIAMKSQMGPIGIPISLQGKEWFVPGVGVVKSESYGKGGKLMGSAQLTSISK